MTEQWIEVDGAMVKVEGEQEDIDDFIQTWVFYDDPDIWLGEEHGEDSPVKAELYH